MAVDITTTGNGSWVGAPFNVESYTVTEESTPLAGGDESGAIGGGSFSVEANDNTVLLMHDDITIADGDSGTTTMRVADVGIRNDFEASIEVDSRMILLLADRSIPPFSGTLGDWFTTVFALCSITSGFTITSSVASRTVTYAAFVGTVWDAIKEVCAAQQIEVALKQGTIEVRLPRLTTATLDYTSDLNRQIGGSQMARSVEVVSYENVYNASGLIYPTGGWTNDVQVLQVGVGERLEFDLPVDVSVLSITQPTPVVWVGRDHSGSSVYSIAGKDGLPIQPAQWEAEGGSLTVSINDDYESLHIVLVGSGNENLGPFQIAMSAGSSNVYSSLRIVGSGVWKRETTDIFLTGVSPDLTAQEVGETIRVPFAFGRAQVVGLGVSAAQRFTGQQQTLSGSVDRLFHSGTAEAAQAFGNMAGSRIKYAHNWWRVRSATITEGDKSFNAEPDTTFGDFDTDHSGKTFAQFDAAFSGLRFSEFALLPLRPIG